MSYAAAAARQYQTQASAYGRGTPVGKSERNIEKERGEEEINKKSGRVRVNRNINAMQIDALKRESRYDSSLVGFYCFS